MGIRTRLGNTLVRVGKTFGTSVAKVTFDKTNTAVRGLEIYQYTKTERKVVAVEEQK